MAALPLSFIDALIKGAVVIGGAAVLVRLLRGQSAAARHAVWTAALLAQLALPVLAIALPSWDLPILPRRTARTAVVVAVPPAVTATAARASSAGTPSAADRLALYLPSVGTMAFAVWLAGFVVVLGRLALGTATVARLARRARRVDDGEWLALTQRTAGTLGIRRPITLLRGRQLAIPVTWGTVYPTVLLPSSAEAWSDERRELVLQHELAHVQRFDALTQLVGQITLALFWMDPLVWLAVHRMAVERERACDDYVLRGGTVASTYAQELLEMVRSLAPSQGPAFAALAIAGPSDFESRLLAILSPNVPRRAMARGGMAAIAIAAALFVLPLASIRPVARPEASPRRAVVRRSGTSAAAVPAPPAPSPRVETAAVTPKHVSPGRRTASPSGRLATSPSLALVDSAGRRHPLALVKASIQECKQAVHIAADGRVARIDISAQGDVRTYDGCDFSGSLSAGSLTRFGGSPAMVMVALDPASRRDTCHTPAAPSNGRGAADRDQKLTLGQQQPASPAVRQAAKLLNGVLQRDAFRQLKLVATITSDTTTAEQFVAILKLLQAYDTLQRVLPATGNRERASAS